MFNTVVRNGQFCICQGNEYSIVDAFGQRVSKWLLDAQDFQANAGTGSDPSGYTTTVVEVGAGSSEAEISDEAGFEVELVTAANDNDVVFRRSAHASPSPEVTHR